MHFSEFTPENFDKFKASSASSHNSEFLRFFHHNVDAAKNLDTQKKAAVVGLFDTGTVFRGCHSFRKHSLLLQDYCDVSSLDVRYFLIYSELDPKGRP